jgi:FtsH-binding integral membrane protein
MATSRHGAQRQPQLETRAMLSVINTMIKFHSLPVVGVCHYVYVCSVSVYSEHGFSQSILFFQVYAVPLASCFMYQSATNALFEWGAVWCGG